MIISVASGKGGTGKTTVAVNLALSIGNIQFLDCDVEEPNAHIFLNPKIEKIESFEILHPIIDESKCNLCGKCGKICEFHAIAVMPKKVIIFEELCHGCGGCALICPQKAITEKSKELGIIRIGRCINDIEFLDGVLNLGQAHASPLIRQVKKTAAQIKNKNQQITIIDAPPGTSCPVINTVKETDFCILVTEPTPFGLNDLILAVETVKKLNIPFCVVINRFDIGDNKVEKYCKDENIPILMKIPFSKEIALSYSEGIPIVEKYPEYKKIFYDLFENIIKRVNVNIQ
jgi:MinD superfamily P-loop ATPase